MMKFSLHEFLKAAVAIKPASYNAGPVNGVAVDRLGFEEALVVVNAGTNGTNGTVDVKVQESDASGSGFEDIAGAVFTQITEANDETIYVGRLNLIGRKRYLRLVATVGTAACVFGAEVLLGAARELPAAQVNAAAFSV
jgi:hypothetical protein